MRSECFFILLLLGVVRVFWKGFMIKRNGQNATMKLAHLNNVCSKTTPLFGTRHTFVEKFVHGPYKLVQYLVLVMRPV